MGCEDSLSNADLEALELENHRSKLEEVEAGPKIRLCKLILGLLLGVLSLFWTFLDPGTN